MSKFFKALLVSTVVATVAHAQTAPAPANPTVPAPTTSNANTNSGVPNSSAFGTVNSNTPSATQPAINPNTGTSTTSSTQQNQGTAVTSPSAINRNTTGAVAPGTNTALTVDQIRAGQTSLNSSGFSVGTIDGRMGSRTAEAIRSFQRSKGLNQTGIFDQATLRALQLPGTTTDDRQPSSINQ